VSTPNRIDVGQAVDRLYPELLQQNTKATCVEFRQRVAAELYRQDGNWGELTKRPGENQGEDGRAVDAVIYRPTMQVVDIVVDGGSERPTRPGWAETGRRQGNDWAVPTLAANAPPVVVEPHPPQPVVTPEPPLAQPSMDLRSITIALDELLTLQRAHGQRLEALAQALAAVHAAIHGERGVGGTLSLGWNGRGTFTGKVGGPA
jgi:hypothetical protein